YWKTRDPVRSPIDKPVRARLVVGSVTTSESLVLYVLLCSLFLADILSLLLQDCLRCWTFLNIGLRGVVMMMQLTTG
ncbi:hypothetical protein B0T18DRAFT_455458, partial [Schizothecium vesticola]